LFCRREDSRLRRFFPAHNRKGNAIKLYHGDPFLPGGERSNEQIFAGNIDGLEFANFFLSAAAALRSSASE